MSKRSRRSASPRSQPQPPIQIDPNQRYSLAETWATLRQSPAKTYVDIRHGKIKVIREGRRTYVPGSELIRLSTLPAA
jgi:hypothetical protein